jgi:UDP-N-acetyl-D-glucosamine dehydrogenase
MGPTYDPAGTPASIPPMADLRTAQEPKPAAASKGDRTVVCVQGLGFVGAAMMLATASAREQDGSPAFDVVGVELDNPAGRDRVQAINSGRLPIRSADPKMEAAMAMAVETGNLRATTDQEVYASAGVAIVDIGLDVSARDGEPEVDFGDLRRAVATLASRMPAGSLIVVETTVPPGTCEKVIAPEVDRALEERGMPGGSILVAHAYERVMPGADYLDSIVNFWRVYAGHTPEAGDACGSFLSKVVNTDDYPLTRVSSTTASEMGKVLENSYRATTIAFMEEWGRFAEAVGVDLFEVIEAIRMRPTHSNIRQPGFGVGGYCLTKDPLFARYGAQELFGLQGLEFPFSTRAVEVNEVMPLVTLDKLEELLGGLERKRVLLLGIAYRQGVGDTRYSPSETFVVNAGKRGAEVVAHDPLVTHWFEEEVPMEVPQAEGFDAVVFAVPHVEYVAMDVPAWLGAARPLVVDANDVLPADRLRELARAGCRVWSIGRGLVSA